MARFQSWSQLNEYSIKVKISASAEKEYRESQFLVVEASKRSKDSAS